MESEGRKIHAQAAHAREEGKHLDSLKLSDWAVLVYGKDSDTLGIAEGLADRSHELMAAVEMAEGSGNKQALAIPYFQLANVQRELGQLEDAKASYQKAIENQTNNPSDTHNRPAVLADMKGHLATCEYKLGDKSALERALTALSELEQTDEVKYNKDVWLSGGHMRIAEILKEDGPAKAKEHLEKAKQIIDANPELKLRKVQWEKLAATFN